MLKYTQRVSEPLDLCELPGLVEAALGCRLVERVSYLPTRPSILPKIYLARDRQLSICAASHTRMYEQICRAMTTQASLALLHSIDVGI